MSVVFEQVNFAYEAGTPFQQGALDGVGFRLTPGSFTAIAGPTGCGKSTLLQMFGGLVLPTQGRAVILDTVLEGGRKPPKLKELRRRVGLVFQFPEHQLFEETVEKDLCFGPLNFGCSLEEAREKAKNALAMVGLSEELLSRSPFQLSGGQMRKAAIASVLAMDPDILVLDEPGASLDPVSREELTGLLLRMCREQGKTIVVVTHRIEEMLEAADHWILMKAGKVLQEGTAGEIAESLERLEAEGLRMPECMHIWQKVARRYGLDPGQAVFSADGLAQLIAKHREDHLHVVRDEGEESIEAGGKPLCETSC